MFKNTQALDKTRDIKFTELDNYSFAAQQYLCPVFLQELPKLVGEYFICFPDNNSGLPHVLLGFERNQNLYVAADGSWKATYIPAYIRRYPFALGRIPGHASDEFTLAADMDAPHFRQTGGAALFYPDGQPTAILEEKISLLRFIENQKHETQEAVRELEYSGLFRSEQVRGPKGQRVSGLRGIEKIRLPNSGLTPGPALELAYGQIFSWPQLENRILSGQLPESPTDEGFEKNEDDVLYF